MQKMIEEMDEFIKKSDIEDLLNKAQTVCVWDFNTSLGNTLTEKYESLHVKIVEASNVLIRKGAKRYFWIVCSPEVSTMFDVTSKLKSGKKHEYYPMGLSEKQCVGTIDKRWRVYVDPIMVIDRVLIGHDCVSNSNDLARISIANFII
jgi:hypothetical protein